MSDLAAGAFTNCGQYVLMDNGRPVGHTLGEVSLAFEPRGALHKHGAPEMVSKWVDTMKLKLPASPAPRLADDLIAITGRFPLDELNKCLTTTGYVLRLYAAAMKGDLEPMPFIPAPVAATQPQAPVRRRTFA